MKENCVVVNLLDGAKENLIAVLVSHFDSDSMDTFFFKQVCIFLESKK